MGATPTSIADITCNRKNYMPSNCDSPMATFQKLKLGLRYQLPSGFKLRRVRGQQEPTRDLVIISNTKGDKEPRIISISYLTS